MWPETPQTQEMLDRAKQGEADAVERLLTTHREPLRRMIDMRLDPALAARVDASDIVQDVLLEAHRRLSDYLRHPTMPFPLLTNARRSCLPALNGCSCPRCASAWQVEHCSNASPLNFAGCPGNGP